MKVSLSIISSPPRVNPKIAKKEKKVLKDQGAFLGKRIEKTASSTAKPKLNGEKAFKLIPKRNTHDETID